MLNLFFIILERFLDHLIGKKFGILIKIVIFVNW